MSGAVKFRTVSRDDPGKMDLQQFFALHRYLEDTYPLVHAALEREIVGGAGLLYRWPGSGGGGLPIMLMAHQDVVPEGDEEAWEHPPFSGDIQGGLVWGRGALDCKSQMIAQLEAVERLISSGFTPKSDVYLAYGCNEEVSSGSSYPSSALLMAQLLESRGVRLGAVLDEGGGCRRDSSLGADICAVTVAEKGYADFELSCSSPGGHSAAPVRGGALYTIARAILAIEENPFPYRLTQPIKERFQALSSLLGRSDPELGRLMSDMEANWQALLPYISSNSQIAPYFHTTMAVTMARGSQQANVLPETASITVNCRLLFGDTPQSVKAYIEGIVPEGVRVRLLGGCGPSPVSQYQGPVKDLLVSLSRDIYGPVTPIPEVQTACTDAKYMYGLSSQVFRFGPFFRRGRSKGAHSVNEAMDIEELSQGVGFYVELLERVSHL